MHKEDNFYVVEMEGSGFPFGEIKENVGEEEEVLVRKALTYSSEGELVMLQKMASFLTTLDSEYVIRLHHMQTSKEGEAHLFYEYVPLKL